MVLDVRMPGLSGLQLQLKLRQMHDTAPVIFVTGNTDERLRTGALRQGATAFFGKPFDNGALLGAIRSALKSSRG
jgi:two-component system, LuxR family, response regulator FixJ